MTDKRCHLHPDVPLIAGLCGGCIRYIGYAPTTATTEITVDAGKLMDALTEAASRFPATPRHRGSRRRNAYAAALREEIKGRTIPPTFPGQAPTLGATEYDLADVALRLADAELAQLRAQLAQLRAERDAALRLADVWDDAPDPLARAGAADLRSAIRGARPPRLLNCGLCYEEHGEEVHPHPECPSEARTATEATDPTNIAQLRAERDQLQRAVDALRRLNELTADGSCRVHAREHAQDNLALLNGTLGEPPTIPATSKASSAREELLNLMAQWGLTTGKGSREIVDRILARHAREIRKTECPPGVHSIFDPCPGDCTEPLPDTP